MSYSKSLSISKESTRQFIICELNSNGIHRGKNGEQLQSMDYFSLLNMLAIHKAKEC